eukprot:2985971-Rhodomonas_salina.2
MEAMTDRRTCTHERNECTLSSGHSTLSRGNSALSVPRARHGPAHPRACVSGRGLRGVGRDLEVAEFDNVLGVGEEADDLLCPERLRVHPLA